MEKQTVVSGLAQAHCACCERTVQGSKLKKTTWEVEGKEQHDFVCYACKFNTFPPGHPLFEKVQAWRAAHGKSVVLATPERIAQFKGSMKVGGKEAKVQVLVSSELRKANDEQMVQRLLHMAATGQMADSHGEQCYVCPNLLGDPVVVQFSESLGGKRRAQWIVCSQACADKWANQLRTMTHRKQLEPQFCKVCDKLEEVCECKGGPTL
jgi:hypothetical protein